MPGLTGLVIGRNDLSGSYGVLGQTEHPQVVEAIAKVLAAAKRAETKVGIVSSSDPAQALRWAEKGFSFVTLDCDDGYLVQASQSALNGTRQLLNSKGIK